MCFNIRDSSLLLKFCREIPLIDATIDKAAFSATSSSWDRTGDGILSVEQGIGKRYVSYDDVEH